MNQIDRKPYMIHADTPCRILSEEELQKMYPHCTTTSEALGELTRAELKTACLHALRRAMREVLPQVALELDLEEGKE